MKKEKKVKSYTRRSKSGKTVTVRAHTAKYDAADKAKEVSKKKGAGDELISKMESKKVSPYDDYGFTQDEFLEWYEGTGSKADKKVATALRKKLGRKAYDELNDLAADNYKKGGANSFFLKNVHSKQDAKSEKIREKTTSESVNTKEAKKSNTAAKSSKAKSRSPERITPDSIGLDDLKRAELGSVIRIGPIKYTKGSGFWIERFRQGSGEHVSASTLLKAIRNTSRSIDLSGLEGITPKK